IAELQHQELELSLRSEFANVWMAYGNNVRLAEFEQENLQVARSYYEIALDRYKLGDLSGIELREAQNSLLDAEERLSTALYSTKLCELSLLQLSGDLLGVEW
ncbi:MAG: TolC family protein, partial [Bacteroidales bacterium]